MNTDKLKTIYIDRNGNKLKVDLEDDDYITIFNGRYLPFDLNLGEIEALYHYSRLVKMNNIEKECSELE